MQKITRDEFIARSTDTHNGKYDYSLVEYVNAYTKVKIICPSHGEFCQRPSDHSVSNGCPMCARVKNSERCKNNTSSFITKATVVHSGEYDYSLSEYKLGSVKVKIICSKHGVFKQRPSDHLNGAGCQKCARDKCKMTTVGFIKKANATHDFSYDYSQSLYVDSLAKIKIICDKHGLFVQTPADHLRGNGCPTCANNVRLTTKSFVSRAIKIHGGKYDYSLVNYTNSGNKIIIICAVHGDFHQIAKDHLNGRGCRDCASTGFNVKTPGILYILRSTCGLYFKAGISNNVNRRLTELRRNTPFDFEPIAKINHDGEVVFGLEKAFHSNFESAQMKGFDGCTEWFKWESNVNDWIALLTR